MSSASGAGERPDSGTPGKFFPEAPRMNVRLQEANVQVVGKLSAICFQQPGVVQAMDEQIRREAPGEEAEKLWTTAGILMGLRYPEEFATELLMRIYGLEDSTFYQGILKKGAVKEAQKILLRQGQSRFGAPADEETTARIQAITDLNRLE